MASFRAAWSGALSSRKAMTRSMTPTEEEVLPSLAGMAAVAMLISPPLSAT